jgi:hypothetical protein
MTMNYEDRDTLGMYKDYYTDPAPRSGAVPALK